MGQPDRLDHNQWPRGVLVPLVRGGAREPPGPGVVPDLGRGGARRDARCPGPRHARRRSPSTATGSSGASDQLRPRPADRAAGHRHGNGAQLRDEHGRRRHRHRPAAHHGPGVRADDDHRRPRDLLRGRRLQQRRRPAAKGRPVARGGVDGPRRRHLADVPADHAAVARARPCSRERSWRSPCRSTRSSSRTFTAGTEETLPKWIFANFRLPNARPIVNVVALVMIR